MEALVVDFKCYATTIVLIYRHPSGSIKYFTETLENILSCKTISKAKKCCDLW